jgi:hypothetical protein
LVFVQPVTPPNIFFPRLHTLSATPQCIFYLLRPVHTFPLLRTINILPPMSFALRDEFDDFETLERAMTHVAHTTKDTYLSLQLAGDSGLTALWLKNTSAEQGSLRFPECTSIRLSSSNLSRFSDAIVTYLPGWLRRFPGLRHVEFGDGCFSENAAADLDLISAIGRACAGIQTIQIRSQKNPISIWLAQKS